MSFRDTYLAAADAFADLVVRLPADGWLAPGLGEWTRRDLLGHVVSSALRQVPEVLANPAGHQEILSPEGYWAFARAVSADQHATAVKPPMTTPAVPVRVSATTRRTGCGT